MGRFRRGQPKRRCRFDAKLLQNLRMDPKSENPAPTESRNAPGTTRHVMQTGAGKSVGGTMSREQFVSEFGQARAVLWCIAASVLRSRSEADDVLQDAAMIGLGKLSEWTPGTSFVAWMSQIVRFVALNHGRKGQRRAATAKLAATQSQGFATDPATDDPNAVAILTTLDTLDEIARTCFLLRTTRSMSYSEISAAIGVPEGTAMSHVFRVRKVLAERHMAHAETGGGR